MRSSALTVSAPNSATMETRSPVDVLAPLATRCVMGWPSRMVRAAIQSCEVDHSAKKILLADPRHRVSMSSPVLISASQRVRMVEGYACRDTEATTELSTLAEAYTNCGPLKRC